MANDPMMVELVCRSGHIALHPLARVLSHDNAWCPRCGADMKLDAAKAKELTDEAAPEKRSNVALRRVGTS